MRSGTTPEIEIFAAKNGMPTARVHLPGKRSLLLHSIYDPLREAQNFVSGAHFQDAKVIILLGVGLGYHLAEVVRQAPAEAKILAIEKHSCLIEWVRQNFKDLPWPRITLTAGEEDIKSFISTCQEDLSAQNLVILEHPPSFRLDQDYYLNMRNKIRDYISLLAIELNTARALGHSVHRNLLKNFPQVIQDPGINILKDVFKKRPAVIIAAGPSLAKNIELLAYAKNRGVLICVGTALKALQKKDIDPDLVVTLDPMLANYRLFENMTPTRAFLCYEPQTYPDILSLFPNRRFVFDSLCSYLGLWLRSLYGAKGEVEPGGSVAVAAFGIACLIGADPIIFVGQDLAYTDGYTHARGTFYDGKKATIEGHHVFKVPAIGGGMVYTSRTLHSFLLHFEELFKKHSDRLIIDATEGGAVKRGTQIMSFKEALNKYFQKEFPVLQRIEELHTHARPPVDLIPKAIKEITETITEYKSFVSRLDDLLDLAETVQKLNDAVASASSRNANDLWSRASQGLLKEKGAELNQALKELNSYGRLIDLLGLLAVEVGLARLLPEDATLAQQLERIRDFYGRYHGAARAMMEQLEELLGKLNSLQSELSIKQKPN